MKQRINEEQQKRKNKKKKSNIPFILIIAVLVGIFIYAGYQAYLIIFDNTSAKNEYDEVVEISGIESILPQSTKNNDGEIEYDVTGMQNLNFEYISKVNDDIIGWIVNPGTILNYPIVQTDNNNTYLYTSFEGKRNNHGCIFMDYNNEPDFSDTNTLIYGHHMKSGAMFASLCEYQNQDYYNEHPILFLYTPDKIYKLEVFSAYIDEPTGIYTNLNFKDESDISSFYDKLKHKSMISTDVELTTSDNIVSLQTCTYEFEDARFIVHAKLVPVE